MEDVKEQQNKFFRVLVRKNVSILVLMEDVKEPDDFLMELFWYDYCFNPCFNGRCKRTDYLLNIANNNDLCFNPCFNGRCKRTLY